jgi:membrane protein
MNPLLSVWRKLTDTIIRVFRAIGQTRFWDALRHYASGLFHRADEDHIFLFAGGLAFSLFVCIVPLTLIIFSVIGRLLDTPEVAQQIGEFIHNIIPYPDYADKVTAVVESRVEEFVYFKDVAGIIGLGGLLLAATSLFSSMRTILDRIYNVHEGQSFLIGKLRDLGLVGVVIIYFILAIALLPALEVFVEFTKKLDFLSVMRLSFVENAIYGLASLTLIFVAYTAIYFLVPYGRAPKGVVFVSALSAAVLWELAKQLFGFYISTFGTFKRIYGAYALGLVVVFWIYYTSIVFIIGAEIGQLYRERRDKLRASAGG